MTSVSSMPILIRRALWSNTLRNCAVHVAAALVRLKALAPYALIELILPGGSVLALLLWFYRRRRNAAESPFLQLPVLGGRRP
jgi:hypothetical protein